MILGPNPGAVDITLIRNSSIKVTKYIAGFSKLGVVIKY